MVSWVILLSVVSSHLQHKFPNDVMVQPFTAEFPHADIHGLLCSDLHQVIKGTFKDHVVTWVSEYLDLAHGSTAAAAIMADIDNQ